MNVARRAARVQCSKDSIFGVLDKSNYVNVLGKRFIYEMEIKTKFLKNFRIFKNLNIVKT